MTGGAQLAIVALGVWGLAQAPVEPQRRAARTPVAFTTVAQGTQSLVREERTLVVRSAAEWQAFWRLHSREPVPSIDFSEQLVAGVFLGRRPSAGYSVEIRAATLADGAAVLQYVERRPAPGATLLQVVTTPFHLVRLPAELPVIEFEGDLAQP